MGGEDPDTNFDDKNRIPQNDTERLSRALVDATEIVAPGWILRNKQTQDDILSLGAGVGFEQRALSNIFPNARRTGIDKDPAGKPFHDINRAAFLTQSIDNPAIYDSKTVRLIISRNPGPGTGVGSIWQDGFTLAWKKLESDGILYVTTTNSQLDSVRETLKAAGIDNFTIIQNEHPLIQAGFPDDRIIIAHKPQ